MIRPIVTTEAILRTPSKSADGAIDLELINDMFETMHEHAGVGLAAIQVGVPLNIAVMECCEFRTAIINPVVVEQSEYTTREAEGCLSIPGTTCLIVRPLFVVIEYTDQYGARSERPFYGLPARVILHELDHMQGRLITDYALAQNRHPIPVLTP